MLGQGRYRLEGETLKADGRVGKRLVKDGITLLVTSLSAEPGTQFTLQAFTRLEAINALQKRLFVAESGKQSGMITLTLTGEDPDRIAVVLNTIAENYLSQNIARQRHRIPEVWRFCRSSYLRSVTNWMRPKHD